MPLAASELSLDDLVRSVEQLNSELASVHQALRELTEQLGGTATPDIAGLAVNTPAALAVPTSKGDHVATDAHEGESAPRAGRRPHAADLSDVPLLSVGEIDVLLGPIASLDELDDIEQRVRGLTGVDAVSVSAFAGREVLLTVELERPMPLAALLRTELGRPVASCRLAEGRIVLSFDEGSTGP